MAHRIDVLGVKGTPLRALYIPAGEAPPNHQFDTDHDMVEFYDRRFDHTPDGQFITRYRRDTFMETDSNYRGLDLHGGEDDWKIDVRTKRMIVEWISYHTYERPDNG